MATASQRYQLAPASDCRRLGVNHTGRSMVSRRASTVPPTNCSKARGHASATWACTRSESTETRWPSTTVSSSPTEKVMAVWSRSHGTDSPRATGATAAA